MENTARTTQLPPVVSEILGFVLLALLILYFVNRGRKKKGKEPIRILPLIKKLTGKKTNNAPEASRSGSGRWYGNYEKLVTVDAFKKTSGKTYVVFDLETTGLDADHDHIVEIGAVRVDRGRITEEYHQMVNPKIKMPREASEVNHITDDMLKGAPDISAVLPSFLEFANEDLLVAHNGGFDASFLDNACARCGLEAPKKYFDTMRLSVYWPKLKNRKLATFLAAAGIENEQAHRALSDARATAQLCIISMNKIK